FCVCTSPVTTAIRISAPRSASVRSSSSVFPEPGEETRLKLGTRSARRRARTRAAISSLRAMTRSRTSIVLTRIVHQLQISQVQGIPQFAANPQRRAAEGRLGEERLQAEREILRLDSGLIAHGDADGYEPAAVHPEPLFGHPADLEGDAHLMHAATPRPSPRPDSRATPALPTRLRSRRPARAPTPD